MPGNDVCDFQQDFLFHTMILDPINGFGKGVDKKINARSIERIKINNQDFVLVNVFVFG